MIHILPKGKIKGVDFCGGKNYHYIIRSDLHCYMQLSDLNKGSDLTVFNLHPSCQNGEHYLGDKNGYFYIIKGKSYRKVTDLSRDSDATVYNLHPNCQGGDHYLSYYNLFYIIFQGKGTFRQTSDLTNDSDGTEYKLDPNCSKGLYYWGLSNCFCFLKPVSEWGVEYNTGSNMEKDLHNGVYSVPPDVINFLPGGLAITEGPAFGKWENIKSIINESKTPVTWQKKIIKKVGYNKEKMKEITHNWKIGVSGSIESGELQKLIAKLQFSFSAEYGGSLVNTDNESWNKASEVEEQLTFQLKPGERLYLWQYKLGLGEDAVLFCHDLKLNDEPDPPTEVPLPLAKS